MKRGLWSIVAAAAVAVFISGCAGDKDLLKAQADAAVATGNARVAEANAQAEEARAVIALSSKVDAGGASAYLVAKAMKGLVLAPTPQPVVQASPGPLALAWQAFLQVADVGLRAYGIKAGRDVAIANTNAQRDTAIASYGAFSTMGSQIAAAGIAGYPYIQAPQPNVTTLSGTGVIGSGTYSAPVTTNTTTTTHTCQGGAGSSGGNGTTGSAGAGGSAPGGTC